MDRALGLLADLVVRLERGEHLLVHCVAGIGRAGTVATCLLIELGMGHEAAPAHVAAHRPTAGPETVRNCSRSSSVSTSGISLIGAPDVL